MLSELHYQWKARVYLIFLGISIFLVVMMYLSQRNFLTSNLSSFYQAIEDANANGEDIKGLLEGSFKIDQLQNMEVINNPLKYYFMSYQASLVAMFPQNGVNQLLSSSFFIVFPCMSGVYGAIIANAEIKYGTQKVHRTIMSQWQINRSKLIASAVSIFSVLFISIMAFIIIQLLTSLTFPMKVDTIVNLDNIKKISYLSNALYQILFIFGISLLYFIITFYLTLVTKNILISIFVLSAYNLFLPVLGRFDFKNIVLNIYLKVFNTNASTFNIATGSVISLTSWIVIIPFVLLVFYILIMEVVLLRKEK